MPANRRANIRALNSAQNFSTKKAALEAQGKEEEERFNPMANLVVAPSHPLIPDIG